MKNDCAKWKEKLLEAALTGTAAGELGRHLSSCAGCVKELEALRARREQLDALLPLVAEAQSCRRNLARECWPRRRPRADGSVPGGGGYGCWPEQRRGSSPR